MMFRTAFTNLSKLPSLSSSLPNTRGLSARYFAAQAGQAEVVLVGCGAPNRGMGWYHAIQMLEGRYVVLLFCFICCLYI